MSENFIYEIGFPPNVIHVDEIEFQKLGKMYNIFIIIGIVLVVLIMVVLIVLLSLYLTKVPKPEDNLNYSNLLNNLKVKTNYIPEENCIGNNLEWNSNTSTCQCKFPYYGSNCIHQLYSEPYYDLGLYEQIQPLTTKEIIGSRNLSYDENSCTAICDSYSECIGIKHQLLPTGDYKCELITSDIKIGGNNHLYLTEDGSDIIFNGSRTHPKFEEQIFVFKGPKPQNYYLYQSNRNGFYNFNMNEVVELNWIPEFAINDGQLVGIWSPSRFNPEDFDKLRVSKSVYVDEPKNANSVYPLEFPNYIKYAPKIYVMYKKLQNLKKI